MRAFFALAAVAVLSAAVDSSFAIQPPTPKATATAAPAKVGDLERIRDLNLTDAQEAAIAAIREEYAPRVEDAVENLSAVVKEGVDAARAVLTEEQKVKLAAMKKEMKIWRAETVAERIAHLRDLDLTDEETAKIADIRKEYRPKIVAALQQLKGTLTPEQARIREEGLKAGKPRSEVLVSLNLNAEQKAKVETVGAEVRGLVKDELQKMRDVLNPEQREKLTAMKEGRREQLRARTFFAIESLMELKLTDQQHAQLKTIQMEYGPRIEQAGNQVRAIVREELAAVVAVLKK